MTKNRQTFSWFDYYFKILEDRAPSETPAGVHGQSLLTMKLGGGAELEGRGELLEHLYFTYCASK